MGEITLQDLANTAWAFAKASRANALLFEAPARAAKLHMGVISVQGLANRAWAFATANQVDALLAAALA